MDNGSFQTWKDRLLFWGTTTGIGLLFGFVGWVTNELNSIPTKEERVNLINAVSPYNTDKKTIELRQDQADARIEKLANIIDKLSNEIRELKAAK